MESQYANALRSADRPRSSGEDFPLLPSVPSPTPAELGPTAVKQLMTWGTLTSTPRVLSQSDDSDLPPPTTPFHLPAPSSREEISHKLSLNAGRSLRAKAALMSGTAFSKTPGSRGSRSGGDAGLMPPPNWTPRRVDAAGSLTPAARRILDRTTSGIAGARRADAMERMSGWENSAAKAKERDFNRVRWTPSPNPVARKQL
jgi:protein DGCR14